MTPGRASLVVGQERRDRAAPRALEAQEQIGAEPREAQAKRAAVRKGTA